jgi:type I restriction enzyme S subunit
MELPIAIPPPPEEKAIRGFIGRRAAEIDELSERASMAVDLLQERRAALICAAVAGKIDVRGLAADLANAKAA